MTEIYLTAKNKQKSPKLNKHVYYLQKYVFTHPSTTDKI